MNTIIAGTDFTPSSVNACRYAAFLAGKLNCKLVLFNLFEAPVVHSNSGLYGISFSSQKKLSEEKVQKVVKKIQDEFSGIKVTHFVISGSFKETLKSFIAKHRVEAVVMGLSAKNRITKFIYGSHGVSVASKIDAPVIIVPEKYKEHSLNEILLAVDNEEELKKTSLRSFAKFLKKSQAGLRLLHVRTELEMMDPEMSEVKINAKKYPVEIVEETDLDSGIKKYGRKQKVDMIVIISRAHSVFYKLFSETNTKKIAFVSKVPVMAIHESL